MTRSLFTPLLCVSALALTACWPEDRSGEQPFAPTVKTVSAVPTDSFCSLEGQVLLSPNSRVLEQMFFAAQQAILERQHALHCESQMKTTLNVVLVGPQAIHWAHVGDSRTYYARGQRKREKSR